VKATLSVVIISFSIGPELMVTEGAT
ncbi:uncharacterized protein METZ01_LOCUS136782, partial [marine metagenome]